MMATRKCAPGSPVPFLPSRESGRLSCLFATALFLAAIAVPTDRALADDFKIVPGERIGDISLAMSLEDVRKLLGTPSHVESEGDRIRYEWRNRFLKVTQARDTGRIAYVATWWIPNQSNPYRTDRGIVVGSAFSQVRGAYGDEGCVYQVKLQWSTRTLAWPALGISFDSWLGVTEPPNMVGRIHQIGVMRPRAARPGEGLACSDVR
jgi:hypothetical protein